MYARGSFSGNYKIQGELLSADCVVAHEFGYRKNGLGTVNSALANFINDTVNTEELPLLLSHRIAGALAIVSPETEPVLIQPGPAINLLGTNGRGTMEEVDAFTQYMEENDLNCPLIVAQAYHVGRIANSYIKRGYQPVVPMGLPKDFDPRSVQIWTRDSYRWAIRESIVPSAIAGKDLAAAVRRRILN